MRRLRAEALIHINERGSEQLVSRLALFQPDFHAAQIERGFQADLSAA